MITVNCPRCFGRGYIPEPRKPRQNGTYALGFYARRCPRCDGRGHIEQDARKYYGAEASNKRQERSRQS